MGRSDRDYPQTPRQGVGDIRRMMPSGGTLPLQYTAAYPDHHRGRWLVAVLLILALLAAVSTWAVYNGYAGAFTFGHDRLVTLCFPSRCTALLGALPPPVQTNVSSSLTDGIGLHICAPQQFNTRSLGCLGDIRRFSIRHLGVVHLSVTGVRGHPFAHPTLTLVLAKLLPHHRSELTLPLPAIFVGAGNNIWAPTVKRLFALTQMKAEVGASYSVEVDDGEVSLGKRTFTVVR